NLQLGMSLARAGAGGKTPMTIIAAAVCFFVLLLGAATVLRESGYEFDLRRRPNRRMLGGRRADDRA
ncbi:MAG TPA: hypothetical protein VK034_05560, partial [Enhygromyxa sp.]|nr:hypothetical protein [Enhygromyxa sp.]